MGVIYGGSAVRPVNDSAKILKTEYNKYLPYVLKLLMFYFRSKTLDVTTI